MESFTHAPNTLEHYIEKLRTLEIPKRQAWAIAVEVMKLQPEALPLVFVDDDDETRSNLIALLPPERSCPLGGRAKHVLALMAVAAVANGRMMLVGGAVGVVAAVALRAVRRTFELVV